MGTQVFVVRRLYTSRTITMNPIGIILSLAAVASAGLVPIGVPASVAVRAPSHDSAIIQSHRLGGNFAYRTDEAHAYAVQTPVLGQRTIPVGVSYHQGTPIVKTTTDYVNHLVPQTGIATYQAPAQVIAQAAAVPAVYAQGLGVHGLGFNGLGVQGLGGVYGGLYGGAYGLNAAGIYSGLPVAAVAAAEPTAEPTAEE